MSPTPYLLGWRPFDVALYGVDEMPLRAANACPTILATKRAPTVLPICLVEMDIIFHPTKAHQSPTKVTDYYNPTIPPQIIIKKMLQHLLQMLQHFSNKKLNQHLFLERVTPTFVHRKR
jgi:hypothetical protein